VGPAVEEPPVAAPTTALPPGPGSELARAESAPALAPTELAPVAQTSVAPRPSTAAEQALGPVTDSRPAEQALQPAAPEGGLLSAAVSWAQSLTSNPSVLWGGVAGVLALLAGLLSIRRRQVAAADGLEDRAVGEGTVLTGELERASEAGSGSILSEGPEGPDSIEGRSDDSRLNDPLAEANVFLAYHRFQQAEDLVLEALEVHPERHEYRLKLLEIHRAARDPAAFEREAGRLRDAVGDESPLMDQAREWWRDLAPGRPFLAGAAGVAAAAVAAAASAGAPSEPGLPPPPAGREASGVEPLDLGLAAEAPAAAERRSTDAVDFELELASSEPSRPSAGGEPIADEALAEAIREASMALDLDLGAGPAITPSAAPAEPGSLDLDLGLGGGEPGVQPGRVHDSPSDLGSIELSLEPLEPTPATAAVPRPAAAPAQREAPSLDLVIEHLTSPPSEGVAATAETPTGARAGGSAFEHDIDFDLGLGFGDQVDVDSLLFEPEEGGADEIGTKLDLARAYMDMGDTEGARGILSEVMSEGTDTQRGEAQDLLAKLG
jgi:pilus assembly protein FimV